MAGLLLARPPEENQVPQDPPAVVCQICHSALSEPIAKASRRPSSFTCTLKRVLIPSFVGLPREFQVLQLPLGATCQLCQSALSEPIAKASRRPSSFTCTLKRGLIPSFVGLPREFQVLQLPLGATCQICQSALSEPIAKASRRPSSFTCTLKRGLIPSFVGLPREFQVLQLPLGATCQICQSALSEPIAKASRRPSSFTCTLKRGLIPSFVGLPREFQVLQLPFGATCQICQSALSGPVAKTSR